MKGNNRSVTIDDTLIISFSKQSFFSVYPDSQKVVEFQEVEHQSSAQRGLDTSLEEMNYNNS